MSTNLRALFYVLVLAFITFAVAKSTCLKFMSSESFDRRRNVWLVLTVLAFVSPSFWLYAIFAFPVMYWAGKKDSNPVAIYLMLLHVVPPWPFSLPAAFINQLFDIDNYRLLAFAILAPRAIQLFKNKNKSKSNFLSTADKFIFSYFLLQMVMLMPFESFTNTLRRAFIYTVDIGLLFYVLSRFSNERDKLVESIAMFVLTCVLMTSVAVMEAGKYWLLYTGIGEVWGTQIGGYLMRGDSLRAQASMGHSLVLGYYLSLGFIFWTYLSTEFNTKVKSIIGSIVIWVGLIAAYSRAPWIAAILGFFVFQIFRPNGMQYLLKSMLYTIPVFVIVLMLPVGEKIIDVLPFVGTVDSANVDYRQRLAEESWKLIVENPLLGDPFFKDKLEHMKQGEGIIDMVNVYADITLQYGVIGLILFLGPFAISMFSVRKIAAKVKKSDVGLSLLGNGIFACMAATAFFIVTGSLGTGAEKMYFILAAIGLGYSGIYKKKAISNGIEISKFKASVKI